MRVSIILVSFLCLVHCQSENISTYYQPENASVFKQEVNLKRTGSIAFPLDKTTGFFQHHLQYVELEGKAVLAFFNEAKRKLYRYDYEAQTLIDTIVYDAEGPNSLGNPYKIGFYLQNWDTIYYYNPFSYTLYQSNQKGQVLQQIRLIAQADKEKTLPAFPDVRTKKPIIQLGKDLYLLGLSIDLQADHTLLKNVVKVNPSTQKIDWLLPRPEIYNQGCWGILFGYQLYHTYNPNTKRFVYRFGISPFLVETDHQGYRKEHFASSQFFEAFTPMSPDKDAPIPREEKSVHDLTSPAFGPIYYDKWRKLYYQIITLPLEEEAVRSGSTQANPASLIILNENFKKIGEQKIDTERYHLPMLFINEKGVHLPSNSDYQTNEDQLSFDIFIPTS